MIAYHYEYHYQHHCFEETNKTCIPLPSAIQGSPTTQLQLNVQNPLTSMSTQSCGGDRFGGSANQKRGATAPPGTAT